MSNPQEVAGRLDRRRVLHALTALGIGSSVFQRALAADAAQSREVTLEMIQQAEWVAGVSYSEADREAVLRGLQSQQNKLQTLRATAVSYDTLPAILFHPAPGDAAARTSDEPVRRGTARMIHESDEARPNEAEQLAFLPVTRLAALIRRKEISSVELTRLYLDRLHAFDRILRCVVTFTDDLALRQAREADAELAAGRYRGPLHGIPWGAKDLIAVPGYKTTWGAVPFRDQQLEQTATVAARLEQAGAVLVAKLSLGALAWGDGWFGGQTRNPWDPATGSSGSSAGSASATAAGLVGFTLGSETLGSIISPCRICGCTGLRPTFGRISRYGCMSLAWSMDKLGPITRSVEDSALVFDAIYGSDGLDPTVVDRPFSWPCPRDIRSLRVGYFEPDGSPPPELDVLSQLGVSLVPIRLPEGLPVGALTIILDAEATAVFDGLVREGKLEGTGLWPNSFRRGELLPAVEYLRANRIRTRLMQHMRELMATVDLYVGGDDLTITNLTGHPTVVLPVGVNETNAGRRPRMLTFTGQLYGESELLAVAHAFERAIAVDVRPDMNRVRDWQDPAPPASPAPAKPT